MAKRIDIIHIAVLAALMGLLMLPAAVFAAAGPVKYLDSAGTEATVSDYKSAEEGDWPKDEPWPTLGGESSGSFWYVLDKDVTYSNCRLTVQGKVNLVLTDGCTLNAKHGIRMAANTSPGASLTVYGQSTDLKKMGALIANASDKSSCAGIGGNDQETGGTIIINGGRIEATGGKYGAGIGGGEDRNAGNITINGGFVTATGGDFGAGIGGGEGGSGGDINIADGTVTATGGKKAAGIGGGQKWSGGGNGGTITIGKVKEATSTLEVTATGTGGGAGIGGGEDGEGGSITINSGTVNASGGDGEGAGIGGGLDAHAGTITINGGNVTAFGGQVNDKDFSSQGGAAGIGAGYDNDSGSKSSTAGGHIIINGGKVKGVGGYSKNSSGGILTAGAGIGSGEGGYGCRIEIHGGDIEGASPGKTGASIGGGYNAPGGVISIDNQVSDPTIQATTCRGSQGYDHYHAIGSGGSCDDQAEVTFDYPNGSVWIEWYFWGYQGYGQGLVTADRRAQTVAAGNGSHREIRISPCNHPGKMVKAVDGGHTINCKYCSEFSGTQPHQYVWRHDEQKHWQVCTVCGSKTEDSVHTCGEDGKCSECGFDSDFDLNAHALTLEEGQKDSSLRVSCDDAIVDRIQWSSSDETVVKVTGSGRTADVEAVKEGTAKITAQKIGDDDLSAACEVTVKHVHKLTKVQEDIEPTCTEDGKKVFYWCYPDEENPYGCGKTFFDEEGTNEFSLRDIDPQELIIPAEGHSGDWTLVQEATQEQEGSMYRNCERCGQKQTITTPKASPEPVEEALSKAADAKAGVSPSKDGSDIKSAEKWAPQAALDALQAAMTEAEGAKADLKSTQQQLNEAADALNAAVIAFSGQVRYGTMVKASEVEKEIMTAGEEGPAGTRYAPLMLRSTKQTKKSIKLVWNKPAKVSRYVIYGNLCGKKNKMKKLAAVSGSAKSKVIKKAGKKLKKGKYYKFIIVGIDANGYVVSMSKVAHVAAKGGKVGNYKSVTVKKAVVTKAGKLKAGSKLSLGAKAIRASKLKVKKHRTIRYESDDTAVATVSSKGVITAKAAGTCYVYAYAQNGVFKKIKVTVQ